MIEPDNENPPRLNDAGLDRAHKKAFYRAVLLHRAFAVPMVFSQDGQVVRVSADEIPIPPEFDPRLHP